MGAGESKTFHVITKDATHSRPQSGPSYSAEVRVRDDALLSVSMFCLSATSGVPLREVYPPSTGSLL